MALHKQNPAGAATEPHEAPACGPSPAAGVRLQSEADAQLAAFQEMLDQTLHTFKLKAARQVATDFPKITRKFLDRYGNDFSDLAAATSEKLSGELKAAGEQYAGEMRQQILSLGREAVEAGLAQLHQSAANVLEEAARAAEERAQASFSSAGVALRSAIEAAEASAARLEASCATKEAAFFTGIESKLTEISAARTDEAGRAARGAAEAVQSLLENALQELKQKAAERIEADLPKAAAVLLERSEARLEKQTGEARERLLDELRQQGAAVLNEARAQFEAFEKSSVAILGQNTKAAAENAVNEAVRQVDEQARAAIQRCGENVVARMEGEQHKLEAHAALSVAEHQKQLLHLSVQGAEGIQRQLESHVESFRNQLQSNLKQFEQQAIDQAKADFPRLAAGLLENASATLERKVAEAASSVQDTLRLSATEVGADAGRRMVEETSNSLRSLRESAVEQTRNQLQALAKDVAGARRKEFESEFEGSLRKQQKQIKQRMDEAGRETLAWLQQASAGLAPGPAAKSSPGSRWALVVVALIPTLLFLYLMSRPLMQLKTAPPADFLNAYPEWTSQHQDVAEKLGEAYWDWAALHLARSYPYGTDLPQQPPVSFEVEGQGFPSGVDADVARMRYWDKLRSLWKDPTSWQKVDVWNAH